MDDKLREPLIVIKYGGHAMDDPALAKAFGEDLAALGAMNMRFVIVHGGGPMINALLKRLKIESEFVNGLRVTSDAVLEAVEMALCGTVNKEVTRFLQAQGLKAVGVSGQDGKLLLATLKDPALGRVGIIECVNPALIQCLLDAGFVPVVAPLALDKAGKPLNVNADTAAGALAGALGATRFILISDVPGVLDAEGQLFSYLSQSAIEDLRERGVISGGMIPKVEACLGARRMGSGEALVLDGRQPNALRRFLLGNEPLGTVINL